MEKTCAQLQHWLAAGSVILDGEENRFRLRQTISAAALRDFASRERIRLPASYKTLLQRVGAMDCFASKYSAGITILAPDEVRAFSHEVFANSGAPDPYPQLFLAISIPATGWFGGFDLSRPEDDNFSLYYAEVPPQYWAEEAQYMDFAAWLARLVASRGKNLL